MSYRDTITIEPGQARWKALYPWHAESPYTTCWSTWLRACPNRKSSMISPISRTTTFVPA